MPLLQFGPWYPVRWHLHWYFFKPIALQIPPCLQGFGAHIVISVKNKNVFYFYPREIGLMKRNNCSKLLQNPWYECNIVLLSSHNQAVGFFSNFLKDAKHI